MSNKIFAAVAVALSLALCAADAAENQKFKLYVRPTPVVAGETAQLVLSSPRGQVTFENIPEVAGLSWTGGPFSSVQIVNGYKTVEIIYQFTVQKPGLYTIPASRVLLDGAPHMSKAFRFKAGSGALSELEKHLYITPKFLVNGDAVYVGQTVPLEIALHKADGFNAQVASYPNLKLDNVVYDDFTNYYGNPRECLDKRFAPYPQREGHDSKDGTNYQISTFLTSFRPLNAGTLSGNVSVKCKLQLPRGQTRRSNGFGDPFDDAFFGDPFGRNATLRDISAALPTLEVKPLPPPPDGSLFLGIIGDWDLSVDISDATLQVGKPVTISVNISGRGSLENLQAPELALSGFNDYPPEVVKGKGDSVAGLKDSAAVKYVLIPAKPGKTNLDIDFAVFQANLGKYKTVKFKRSFDIAPSPTGAVAYVPRDKSKAEEPTAVGPKAGEILYLKKQAGQVVLMPLWRNHAWAIATLLLGGPLFWALVELLWRRRLKLGSDPALRRRLAAKGRAGKVLADLRKADSASFPDAVRGQALPYINDLKGFPPGATSHELESLLDDRELVDCLKQAETLSYMPGSPEQVAGLRDRLVKRLGRLAILALAFVSLQSNAADMDKILAAYDDGDFTKAAAALEAQLNPAAPSPALLYNLGDCFYQRGDLPRALLCYERALRLAPRDSDILENLNYVRRQLILPQLRQARNPLDFLGRARDLARPDEWLLLGAFAWALLWLGLALRRLTPSKVWIVVVSVAGAGLLSATAAWFSLRATTYNSADAIVLERNAEIHVLPSDKSAKTKFSLVAGEDVRIEERRNDWVRVRSGNAEGWVKSVAAGSLWPY